MLGAICGGVYLLEGPSFQPFDIDFDPTGKRWIWAICVTFKSSLFINPNTVITLLENRKLKQKLMADINQELRESWMHESSLAMTKCNRNNRNFSPIFQRKIRNFFDSLRPFSCIAAMRKSRSFTVLHIRIYFYAMPWLNCIFANVRVVFAGINTYAHSPKSISCNNGEGRRKQINKW